MGILFGIAIGAAATVVVGLVGFYVWLYRGFMK